MAGRAPVGVFYKVFASLMRFAASLISAGRLFWLVNPVHGRAIEKVITWYGDVIFYAVDHEFSKENNLIYIIT
jgi:basic membrane lipoprotein Med (substrate-binding protein (PBP1-ABC) superfamily)